MQPSLPEMQEQLVFGTPELTAQKPGPRLVAPGFLRLVSRPSGYSRRMSQQYVEGVRTSSDPLDLRSVSRDLWPGNTLRMWLGERFERPDQVVWPETEQQVLAVLERASADRTPVVTYGAGSGVCGGAAGKTGSIVLDTKAMDTIGPLDSETWTVEAGAGVNGQHLEDWLAERGFTCGHSPSSIWCSTVGGWAAARGAGQFSSRYGVFEDMVVGLRGVAPGVGIFEVGDPVWADALEATRLPDGDLEMLMGSEGTLGVITRVRLRVWPVPESRWLRGYSMPDVETAVTAMRRLMQEELWPSVVRLYDPVDTRIGGKTKPKTDGGHGGFLKELIKAVDKVPALSRHALSLPLAMPGLINQLFEGLSSGCFLVIGWEGDSGVVNATSTAGHVLLEQYGQDLGADPGWRWFNSRHAVSFKLMPIFERGGFADTMEVACRWSDLVTVYNEVRDALSKTTVVMAHMSHLYPEGGSIYFSFAGKGDVATYERTWSNALAAIRRVLGTVTHHHGVGTLKAAAATAEIGPAIQGWKQARARLDPQGIMNPGRLFLDGVASEDPGAMRPAHRDDGLMHGPAQSTAAQRQELAGAAGREPMFPWQQATGRPRWFRAPWQITHTEVAGEVQGQRCLLGRGPRSAAGPDLRPWLISNADTEAIASFAVPNATGSWMGSGRPPKPWAVARALLRSDLRPSVLAVHNDELFVGFRGLASQALGELASSRVPGGLTPGDWKRFSLPCGDLTWCDDDDPAVVDVVPGGAMRRRVGDE